MSEVQRFDLTELTDTYCGEEVTKHYISPVEDGEYVQHSDYESLQARLAQCEGERDQWKAACDLVEAVMQRDKLKAERDAALEKLQAMYAKHPEEGRYDALPNLRARLATLESAVKALPVVENVNVFQHGRRWGNESYAHSSTTMHASYSPHLKINVLTIGSTLYAPFLTMPVTQCITA